MKKLPRFVNLKLGDLEPLQLPPVCTYDCFRSPEPILVNGALDRKAWARAPWSEPFVKMDLGTPTKLESRIALLWDEQYLYAAYRFEDHDIWGTHVQHHEHVYLHDSDAEIFIEGIGCYYELGINPINTIYEVFWTWIEPVVQKQDWATLDRFFKTQNFLYFAPRLRDSFGRFGELDWELPGLKHAVQVDGTLNCPSVRDNGWTVEFALPWEGLKVLGKTIPPRDGDIWRIGACRCQHFRDAAGNNTSEDWSWNQHGFINMHIPERRTNVRFLNQAN